MSDVSNGVLNRGYSQTFLGKMTTYRRGDKTVMRGTTPTTISNPQSALQMYQRLKFPNLNTFYRAVHPFIRRGWESKPANHSLHNCFTAANLDFAPFAITHDQLQAGFTIVEAYQITSGTLPSIVINTFARGTNLGVSDIRVGELSITPETTLGEFSDAVITANKGRFANGDEIAFLSLVQVVTKGVVRVRSARTAITLNQESDQPLAGLNLLGFGVHNGFLALSEIHPDGGYCWVHSRKEADGVLRVSTQSVQVVGTGFIARFRQPARMRAAAESYGATFEDTAFLDIVSEKTARILRAFGITVRSTKDEATAEAAGPTISFVDYDGLSYLPDDPAPTIRISHAPTISANITDIKLFDSSDSDDLTVAVNGVECTSVSVTGSTITATLPSSLDTHPLTMLTISSATDTTSATFRS